MKKKVDEVFINKLLKFSLGGIYVYDFALGLNIYINNKYTELTGYDIDFINGLEREEFLDLFHPDDKRAIINHMKKVSESKDGEVFEIEYRFKKSDGSWFWCLSKDAVFDINEEGECTQFIGHFIDITEEKLKKEELFYANERVNLAIDSASMVIWETNVLNEKIAWEGDVSKIYGCSVDEIATFPKWSSFLYPEDLVVVGQKMKLAEETKEDQHLVFRITDTEGKLHYVRASISAIFDQTGEVIKFIGTNRDITLEKKNDNLLTATRKELLQLNETVEKERKQLQYYLDTIPSIILILDEEGKIKLVNEFACNFYGYNRNEMLGKDFLQTFIPDRLLKKTIEKFNKILDGGIEEHRYVENWGLCKDKSEKLIAWKNSYIYDENGKIAGTISVGDDITKQSRINEQILFLKELSELAIETHDINTILYKALESICVFTQWPFGHIYLPDSKKEKLIPADVWYMAEGADFSLLKEKTLKTSFAKGEGVLGTVWKEQKAIWVDDLKDVEGIKRKEEALKYGFKGVFSMPVPLGGEVVAVLEFFYKKSKNERYDLLEEFIEQLQLQLTTIIDRHKFQNELEDSKIRAEDANRAKSLFLANMSHEIRTPMNAILGHAQILRRDKGISKEQKSSIVAINKSGNHLLGLINNILNLSKIETGKMELSYSSFDPTELINELGEIFKFQINQKGLELLIEKSDELPPLIQTDKNKVRQILINLMANAVKFTENGSIMINTSFKNGNFSIAVSDTGIGISKDYLETIFETFEQAADGMNKEGTGLGLSISKKLAQLMKGDITVESKYGKGSCFTFTLPYIEGEQSAILEEGNIREVDRIKEGQNKIKILIVDDIAENREVLELLLNGVGFIVKSVQDGKQAVSKVEEWMPDVVLMDMVMPVMDGIEATRKIRSLAVNEKVNIIGISASAFDEERNLFLKSGANSFVKKPFKISELLNEIQICTGVEYNYIDRKELGDETVDIIAAKDGVDLLPSALRENIERAIVEGDTEQLRAVSQEMSSTNKELFDLIQNHLDSYDLEGLEELFN